MKRLIQKALNLMGLQVVRFPTKNELPSDVSEADRSILATIAEFTMTSVERQIALIQSVRYLVQSGIAGSFVECGVWRGGSSMAVALTLLQEGVTDRDLYLYDTFEGMTPPTSIDRLPDGTTASELLGRDVNKNELWCVSDLETVRRNISSTGFPSERIHLIRGPVEATIPATIPDTIALLRLDTDWYESTRHELKHLFSLVSQHGIVIIDDYGHWQGAKQAVDEFLLELGNPYYLHRIDYTGRLLLKC